MSWGFGFDCCCGCEIYADDFTTDHLALRWEERGDAWVVAGGKLEATPTDATLGERSVLITNEAVPASVSAIHETVHFSGDAGNPSRDVNGKFLLIFAYESDDAFWFAEIDLGGSGGPTLSIVQRFDDGGGAADFTHATVDASADGDGGVLSVCYSENRVVAHFTSGILASSVSHNVYIDLTDTHAGLAAQIDGTAIFDNFAFSKHEFDEPDCPTCDEVVDCDICDEYGAPATISVTITGIIDEAGCFADDPGDTCDDLNKTYVLDYVSSCFYEYEEDSPCNFQGVGNPPCRTHISAQLTSIAGQIYLSVVYIMKVPKIGGTSYANQDYVKWSTYPTPIAAVGDSCSVGEVTVPWSDGSGFVDFCESDGSSITATL